jgi:hypothetical protein
MASYSGRETREGFAMFKCERTMYNEKLWWTQSVKTVRIHSNRFVENTLMEN